MKDDYLVRLANDKTTANLVKSLGLPTPVRLRRSGTDLAQPLAGARVLAGATPGGYALNAALHSLRALGAEPLTALPDDGKPLDAVLLDATGCTDVAALRVLYEAFQPLMRRLARCARLVLLAPVPSAQVGAQAAACARGIEGFVRALAKEVGKRGATANLLYVERGAQDQLGAPLRFFCGDGCAYVSGQALTVSAAVAAATPADAAKPLAGKLALVTGAARGIGAAVATRLASAGAKIICLDVGAARTPLYELALRLGGVPLALDITAPEAPAQLASMVRERFGALDVVVHNAGITRDKTLANMTPAQWDAVLAVNLQAIFAVDAQLDAEGLWHEGLREVCLSSISGIAGNYGQSNYATSKAALIGYVAARAAELAPRGGTINAIAPGFIETPMTQKIPLMTREAGRRLNSLAQGGLPEDVAEAIAFLCRPDAHGISGQTLRVCGQGLIGA